MKKIYYILLAIVLSQISFQGCSSTSTPEETQEKMVLLGSFEFSYDAASGLFYTVPINKNNKLQKLDLINPGSVNNLLDYENNSITKFRSLVTIQKCGTDADWNAGTSVLSDNYKIANITNPSENITIIPPLEMHLTYIVSAANLIHEITTDLPGQGCPNPLQLSTCDSYSNNFVPGADGFFDIIWPNEPIDYNNTPEGRATWPMMANDPGQDFSLLMGADYELTAGEATSCKFAQFKLTAQDNFTFGADIWGQVKGEEVLSAPLVDPITSPTNDLFPNLIVNLNGGNAVRIAGGAQEMTCTDNDIDCDLQPSTANVVEINYELCPNTASTILVYQQDTNLNIESPATVVSIIHDNVVPSVISINPTNGAINVSPATNILVTFDGSMKTSSIISSTLTLYTDNNAAHNCTTSLVAKNATLSFPTSTTVRIDPNTTLTQNQWYCVKITGLTGSCDGTDEIQDLAGNCLETTIWKQFKTYSSDSVAPLIISTFPTDGANGMSISTPIRITFNESMIEASVISSANFVIQDDVGAVSGSRTLSADGMTVTFTPTANYQSEKRHTVTMTTNAEDLTGNNLAQNFVFYFTTGQTLDETLPSVTGFLPVNLAENISEYYRPQISFSEPMDPATISTSSIHLKDKNTNTDIPFLVSLSSNGQTATIEPLSALDNNTLYLISVEYSCTDLSGNNLSSPQTSEFTTQENSDSTDPWIVQVTPMNNAVDVGLNSGAVLVFSEPIDPNSVHTGTFYMQRVGGSIVNGTVSVNTDLLSATFSHPVALTKNVDYYIIAKGGSTGCSVCMKDLAGRPMAPLALSPLPNDVISKFNTEFKNVGTITKVISIGPGSGAINVDLNSNIVVQFSAPLNVNSISDSSFYITMPPSTTHVSGLTRLLADGISIRFTPANVLLPSTTYRITATSSINDLSYRAVESKTSDFTTSTVQDTNGPTLQSSIPNDEDINVARWKDIEVTFNEPIDASTVNQNNVELIRDFDSSKVAVGFSMSSDSKTIKINPLHLLNNDEYYTVHLKTEIRNLVGFALQNYSSIEFQTINNSSDTTRPTVSFVDPLDGDGNVSRNKVITITLSESVDPDMIKNGIVTVSGGSSPPKGDVTITFDKEATRTIITITPNTSYSSNTWYTIRLKDLIVDDANNKLNCATAGDGQCDGTDWISKFRT